MTMQHVHEAHEKIKTGMKQAFATRPKMSYSKAEEIVSGAKKALREKF